MPAVCRRPLKVLRYQMPVRPTACKPCCKPSPAHSSSSTSRISSSRVILVRSTTLHPPRTTAKKRRSEEHTSELQSRPHLVCRLLLEKKKIQHVAMYRLVVFIASE